MYGLSRPPGARSGSGLGKVVVVLVILALVWVVGDGLWNSTLGKALHIHIPSITQLIHGTTSEEPGPVVFQAIEKINDVELAKTHFQFAFTRTVSKSIGPWPCWYSSTFEVVGSAAATVDLNPGPKWWTSDQHYSLKILKRPSAGQPGQVAVTMTLPEPQLPKSEDDVDVNDHYTHPVATDHSWTYPGLGCGALLKPQFAQSVMYQDAQAKAFEQVTHAPQIVSELISSAKSQAYQIIRYNFIQQTVNGLGYKLVQFNLNWVNAPSPN